MIKNPCSLKEVKVTCNKLINYPTKKESILRVVSWIMYSEWLAFKYYINYFIKWFCHAGIKIVIMKCSLRLNTNQFRPLTNSLNTSPISPMPWWCRKARALAYAHPGSGGAEVAFLGTRTGLVRPNWGLVLQSHLINLAFEIPVNISTTYCILHLKSNTKFPLYLPLYGQHMKTTWKTIFFFL